MNILITLCGRAGSKGCANKNIREFDGYPLIYYTLAAAIMFREKRKTDRIDICVDSDSEDILLLCNKVKKVILSRRPAEFAQDNSPKMEAIRNALNYTELTLGIKYDAIIDLDITSPLRKIDDIEKALDKQIMLAKEVVFSVVPSRRNPYFNMVEDNNGIIKRVLNGAFTTRQAAPKVYDMNASIYCYSRKFLSNKMNYSPLNADFDITYMEDTHIIDIDSDSDFICLEILWNKYYKRKYVELTEIIKNLI